MKKFFERKEKRKKQLLKFYQKGYEKAESLKNEEIRRLKIKHSSQLRQKDNIILNQQKKVDKIEESLNKFSEIVCQVNAVIKKIKNDSYANTMMNNNNHQRIETMNDEVERLELKVGRSKEKLDTKILEFKRAENE